MGKVLSLIKVISKDILSLSRNKGKNNKLTYIIFLGIMLICISAPLGYFAYEIGQNMGTLSTILIQIALPLITMFILFLSIYTNISVFFLAKDIQEFLHLPLKPWQILSAKMISSFFITWVFEVILLLPIFLGIGIGASFSILYFLYALIGLLLIPIVPSCLTAILITSLMRFSNLAKSKNRLTYIVYGLTLVMAIGLQLVLQNYLTNNLGDITVVANDIVALYDTAGALMLDIMIFIKPLSYAITNFASIWGLLNILLQLIIVIGVFALFLLIGEKIYLRAIISGSQKKSPSKKEKQIKNKGFASNKVLKTYVLKEWREIVRTPIYLLNLLGGVIIMPIVLIFSLVTSTSSAEVGELLAGIVVDYNNLGAIMMILGAVLMFSGMVMISSTAISRDGKNAIFIKHIPLAPITQVHAKIFLGVLLNIITALFICAGLFALGIIDILLALIIFITFIGYSLFANYIQIYIDLKRPKLNWSSEQAAVKQNFNAVIVLLIDMVLAMALFSIGATQLGTTIPYISFIACGGLGIIFFAISFAFYQYFKNKKDLFEKIN